MDGELHGSADLGQLLAVRLGDEGRLCQQHRVFLQEQNAVMHGLMTVMMMMMTATTDDDDDDDGLSPKVVRCS